MLEKALRRYLKNHAEPEAELLQDFPLEGFQHVIVIPAHREPGGFLIPLQQLAEDYGATLVILIINRPDTESRQHEDAALWELAAASGSTVWEHAQLKLVAWQNRCALLLVDRFTQHPIPHKQGVGLARKIGCDVALALRMQGRVLANFVHNSDADAELPADYFDQTKQSLDVSALLYPFSHSAGDDPRINRATAIYEASLHYYVKGLRWAGSPYAFHTIGSCMAVSMQHYAQARGFPKRAGGEDFYLLNKLAKLAPVVEAQSQPIRIRSRASDRVPFGTGPAVAKILALPSDSEFSTYAPDIFVDLRQLLEGFDTLWHFHPDYPEWFAQLPRHLQQACVDLGMESLFSHLQKQARSERQCRDYAHHWFDGFRTLKFVRHLQSLYYPAMPLSAALDRARRLWQLESSEL